MGARVGSLLVEMALNTAAFASDLSKSNSALSSWAASNNKTLAGVANGWRSLSKELTGMTSGVFTLRNALLSVVGGGAFGMFVKEQLEAASVIVDTADNIGVSTKALQEYTYAARLSGIGTEQLQTSMKTFATSLGQAHAGAGKLYTFLQNSNVTLLNQVVGAKSVDEALDAVFTTMGKLTSQTDRLALAQAAFGKKNLDMVNLVKDGVPAFELMRQKANELGIVIEEGILRNAEDAGDKVDTLAQVFKAQLVTAVAANAKEIGEFAEQLTKAIPMVVGLATEGLKLFNFFASNWTPATIALGTALATLAIRIEKNAIAMAMLTPAGLAMFSTLQNKWKELDQLEKDVAAEAADRMAKAKSGYQDVAAAATPMTAAHKEAATAAANYAAQQKAAADAAKQGAADYKKLQEAAAKIKQDHQGALSNYLNDVAQLDLMLKKNLLTWDEYQRAVTDAQEKNFHTTERVKKILGETEDAQEKYNAQMKELNELRGVKGGLSEEQYQQAVTRTTAALAKARMEGSLLGKVMDDAIDGNIKSWKDLGRVVIDFGKTLLKSLASGQGFDGKGGGIGSLLGGAGSLLGSLFGSSTAGSSPGLFSQAGSWIASLFHSGGVVGSAGGMSRSVDPSVFANAPRFHTGGLVGGEVPIIAKKGERVLTEQQQRMMGAGGDTYYIDARGADAGVEERLRMAIMEMNNSIESRAVKAVTNARARNPQIFSGAV